MLLHALGILCGLAAVVFASLPGAGARLAAVVYGACFTAAATLITPMSFPAPEPVALVIAGAAACALYRPRWALPAIAVGGAAGGLWLVLLRAQGLPLLAVIPLVAGPGLVTFVRSRATGPRFAPPRLLDEALLIVGLFALVLAAAQSIAAGLSSASVLRTAPIVADSGRAGWALGAAALCVVIGGLFAIWRRR